MTAVKDTARYSSAPINTSPFVQTVYRASMNQLYGKPFPAQTLFNNLALDFHTLAYRDEGIITSFDEGDQPDIILPLRQSQSNPRHQLELSYLMPTYGPPTPTTSTLPPVFGS